jgi:hypothetical protein
LYGGSSITGEQVSRSFAGVYEARDIIEGKYLSDPQVAQAYKEITAWEGQIQNETDRAVMS